MKAKFAVKAATFVVAFGLVAFGGALGANAAPATVQAMSHTVSVSSQGHVAPMSLHGISHHKAGCRYVSKPPTQPWYLCLFYTNNMGPYGCYSHNVWSC